MRVKCSTIKPNSFEKKIDYICFNKYKYTNFCSLVAFMRCLLLKNIDIKFLFNNINKINDTILRRKPDSGIYLSDFLSILKTTGFNYSFLEKIDKNKKIKNSELLLVVTDDHIQATLPSYIKSFNVEKLILVSSSTNESIISNLINA